MSSNNFLNVSKLGLGNEEDKGLGNEEE